MDTPHSEVSTGGALHSPLPGSGLSPGKAVIKRFGGASGLVATAAPTLVFVVADRLGGLRLALVATTVTVIVVLAWRLRAKEQVRHAVIGALVAVACAAVAAGTGEAKGFFLLPILIPAVATVVCVLSMAAGRPLAGLVANRLVGGPPRWRSYRPLRRFYGAATLLISVVSLASLVAQVILYRQAEIAWLAVLHILMGPLWLAVTAASLLLSRMAVTRYRKAARQESEYAGAEA
ncbi:MULTISPECIES: DUF3159 domain-containing protein [Streptomyces]|uniref:DUF3159 domain-containing protein n=2 Tax=Streptomyces rimosus subsp. rimosus TaxID=132474 RepID=A0A8A1UF28_STRR1|nr:MULTISPECIES: DUF3159 domain-containing protein [Streptomyces]MYT41942.1 DUF3159 domain-containing protein [Streptomyces sp. SID5471]QDA08780.1 DUF3159 domain-containing protein [Streptomyces rimosus]QEV80058.1 DUF3159 domain-containing protein [Streptomyces rimosus]QGY66078.1 DUF3159 domain-containing protein [Streptomyces rimosus R6-500]QST79180.1 DUF3159 domain-containing protein [Streptomyces rimosus subsp. rimosus ATCC 10970]